MTKGASRFATLEEVMSPEFMNLTRVLDKLTVQYELPDHSDANRERYPWSQGILSPRAFYAARMWEYPYALTSAELQPGMRCADIGCGMTAFTIYLKEVAQCEVVGVDPDVFDSGVRYYGHGVSREFIQKTGIELVQSGLETIPLPSNTFDRVFCLSVIEHLTQDVIYRGVREIARIVKPGGRAIFTMDVNMLSEVSRPLDLIWESGLVPWGNLDLRWPTHRFGNFCDGKQPADVYGMCLVKEARPVETQYASVSGDSRPPLVDASLIPVLRSQNQPAPPRRSLWRRVTSRVRNAGSVLIKE
jgi:SAM-dependent methyltransferase